LKNIVMDEYNSIKRKVGNLLRKMCGHFYPSPTQGLRKLDFGCGPAKQAGYLGTDRAMLPGVDVVCDFEAPYLPFTGNSFGHVYASNTIEHLSKIISVMQEIHRVLRKGGTVFISVPYYRSAKAFQDPTHVRFFTINTFDYFVTEQTVAPKWYFPFAFSRITRRSFVFKQGLLALLLSPIINSSLTLQRWYEGLAFIPVIPVAIQVEIVK
jgi:SAM-dependent methyltransferase